MVGDINGPRKSVSFLSSPLGRLSHLKCSPQLKPPRTNGLEVYVNVSALMMSMTGITRAVRLAAMRANSGSLHPAFTSMWLSRKMSTSPVALREPYTRDRIRPSRCELRNSRMVWFTLMASSCCSSGSPRSTSSLQSSMRMISCSCTDGVRCTTVLIDRSRVARCSL